VSVCTTASPGNPFRAAEMALTPVCPMLTLPPDLQTVIANHLPTAVDLSAFRQTCRQLAQAGYNELDGRVSSVLCITPPVRDCPLLRIRLLIDALKVL